MSEPITNEPQELELQEMISEDENKFFLDKMRTKWDQISLQSDSGARIIKAIFVVMIFFSMRAISFYGLQFENSAISNIYRFIGSNEIVFMAIEAAIAVLCVAAPALSGLFFAIFMFCCLGGISPFLIALAAIGILFASTECRTVTVAAMIMPALVISLTEEQWTKLFGESAQAPFGVHFLLTTGFGFFILMVASFASIKMVGGAYGSVSFLSFGIISISFGLFGKLYKDDNKSALAFNKNYWKYAEGGNADKFMNKAFEDFKDFIMLPSAKALLVLLAIAIIFTVLVSLKFKGRKLNIDLRDGIAFAAAGILLCLSGKAITGYAGFDGYTYTAPSIIIQVLLAYIFTRPISGRMPTRAVSAYSGNRAYIFISYAHSDIARVKPYLKMLEKEGYDFWYDDSIQTGSEWQEVIASNLADCSCFFAFISKSSIVSDYCLKEINYATSKNKPIAIILLDDVPLPPVLEMHLASLQAVQRSKFNSDTECMNAAFELEALKNCKY